MTDTRDAAPRDSVHFYCDETIHRLVAERDAAEIEANGLEHNYAELTQRYAEAAKAEREGARRAVLELLDLAELAWGVIANASGGNWEREHHEWQGAAATWRDRFYSALARHRSLASEPAAAPLSAKDRARAESVADGWAAGDPKYEPAAPAQQPLRPKWESVRQAPAREPEGKVRCNRCGKERPIGAGFCECFGPSGLPFISHGDPHPKPKIRKAHRFDAKKLGSPCQVCGMSAPEAARSECCRRSREEAAKELGQVLDDIRDDITKHDAELRCAGCGHERSEHIDAGQLGKDACCDVLTCPCRGFQPDVSKPSTGPADVSKKEPNPNTSDRCAGCGHEREMHVSGPAGPNRCFGPTTDVERVRCPCPAFQPPPAEASESPNQSRKVSERIAQPVPDGEKIPRRSFDEARTVLPPGWVLLSAAEVEQVLEALQEFRNGAEWNAQIDKADACLALLSGKAKPAKTKVKQHG